MNVSVRVPTILRGGKLPDDSGRLRRFVNVYVDEEVSSGDTAGDQCGAR